MIKWIHENREQFDKATFIGMTGKDIMLDQWLIDMESPRMVGDEFALFALCKLFNRHARVLNQGKTWHSVSYEGSPCEEYIEEACDVHLLYLAKDTIAELRKKTIGTATSSNPTTVTSTARPLGLHNLPLPDVPLPTLLDETAASEEPSKIVPLQDYVTTLGSIVPLPQDALHIPENLIQSDNIIEDQMDASIPAINDWVTEQTKPCLIKLRRISQIEVSKWQKPKLLDETNSGTRNANGNYNLREKKVENKQQSSRPQCMTIKPPTYVDPTDESSQDSQVIGTIYSLDKRPIPDEKLEKIVSLSEPSTYRMGAQNYIAAKRRGELPAFPTQTLPGFKANPHKLEQPEEPQAGEESVDSEDTIIYTPPKLQDRTDSSKKTAIKGKLHIKKLSLRKAKPTKKDHCLFRCVKCTTLFNTIAELNDHFINKHWNISCKGCDKTFDKPRSYEKHLYAHKLSRLICNTCGKGFAFKSQLDAHTPTHSGVRKHHCTETKCSKSFTHPGDLKKHLRTHSKKWWRCEVAGCFYKNRDSHNLKSHMISHSTKKSFECKYCATKFKWSMQLVCHYKEQQCIRVKHSRSPSY